MGRGSSGRLVRGGETVSAAPSPGDGHGVPKAKSLHCSLEVSCPLTTITFPWRHAAATTSPSCPPGPPHLLTSHLSLGVGTPRLRVQSPGRHPRCLSEQRGACLLQLFRTKECRTGNVICKVAPRAGGDERRGQSACSRPATRPSPCPESRRRGAGKPLPVQAHSPTGPDPQDTATFCCWWVGAVRGAEGKPVVPRSSEPQRGIRRKPGSRPGC